MDHRARPYRSVLYIPGSKPRALEKARTLPTDAIIFDLEDAVSADEKQAARALLAEMLDAGGYGAKAQLVLEPSEAGELSKTTHTGFSGVGAKNPGGDVAGERPTET